MVARSNHIIMEQVMTGPKVCDSGAKERQGLRNAPP
jgi:hypothetical protein